MLISLMLIPSIAQAQTFQWAGRDGDAWSDPDNWSDQSRPNVGFPPINPDQIVPSDLQNHVVRFLTRDPETITFSEDISIISLHSLAADPTLELGGHQLNLLNGLLVNRAVLDNDPLPQIVVPAGSLTIRNGQVFAAGAFGPSMVVTGGDLRVQGIGSLLSAPGFSAIGNGNLYIEGGAFDGDVVFIDAADEDAALSVKRNPSLPTGPFDLRVMTVEAVAATAQQPNRTVTIEVGRNSSLVLRENTSTNVDPDIGLNAGASNSSIVATFEDANVDVEGDIRTLGAGNVHITGTGDNGNLIAPAEAKVTNVIAEAGNTSLSVDDGYRFIVNDSMYLGGNSGGRTTGTAVVDVTDGELYVQSDLHIYNGSTVNVSGASASENLRADRLLVDGNFQQDSGRTTIVDTLAVDASGSFDLSGGDVIAGELTIDSGGTFNFDVGKLTIDGGIFDHSSQHLKFGLGSRDLSLLNGAEAHLQSMSFGNFNTLGTNSFRIEGGTTTVDASVVVDGVTMTVADADLQFGDTLRIGSTQSIFGNPIPFAGTFVHNGGTTAGDIVSIGDTSTGDYTISAGTLDVNSIVAGNNTESATFDGVGTFTQTGGNVVVTDAITLGAHADSQGTYQLDGGTLTAGSINISPDSSFNFTGGALQTVQFVGELAQDGGLITIGNSPGVMDIDGNYLMNAGALEIELGGYLSGSEFDFLDVSGTAMLDGQLDVLFIDGFLPAAPGDSFTILQADGGITLGSGFVANLPDLSHLGPHSAWQVNVNGNSLALSVVPEPSGMALAGMAGWFGVAVARRRRRSSVRTTA